MEKLARKVIRVMLLAVVLYGAFVAYRGVGTVGARLSTFAWWTFAGACGLSFVNYGLRFIKWEYYLALLDIRGVPKVESYLTFLSGFVLTVTPGKVGEVFKSLVLYQTRGVAIARTAPIVVAERVTDLIAVILLITVGSASFPGGAIWASAGALAVLSLLAFISSERLSAWVLKLLAKTKLGAKFAPKIAEALAGLRVLTTPRRLVFPTLLSVVGWGLEGVGLWLILQGFGELTTVPPTLFCYATSTLAGALVPVPGGLGVTEGLLEQQMHHLGGVSETGATSAMLLCRFATLWFGVALGFLALGVLRTLNPGMATADDTGSAQA